MTTREILKRLLIGKHCTFISEVASGAGLVRQGEIVDVNEDSGLGIFFTIASNIQADDPACDIGNIYLNGILHFVSEDQ